MSVEAIRSGWHTTAREEELRVGGACNPILFRRVITPHFTSDKKPGIDKTVSFGWRVRIPWFRVVQVIALFLMFLT